jgi:electron transfer flavoprotein beta subunit
MNILVLIAGVLDPKWPVVADGNGLPARPADRLIMSPFDEAALEIALQIRDRDPETTIRAVIAGGHESERVARAVAAFNVSGIACLRISASWDQGATARELAAIAEGFSLIVIGREFGDCDDGVVPSMLAAILDYSFFSCAQTVEVAPEPCLMRESGAFEERVKLTRPMVASVTNDRRTRLRKPLMKNVMMARQLTPDLLDPVGLPSTKGYRLNVAKPLASARAATTCRMLDGTPEEQARVIANMLLEVAA